MKPADPATLPPLPPRRVRRVISASSAPARSLLLSRATSLDAVHATGVGGQVQQRAPRPGSRRRQWARRRRLCRAAGTHTPGSHA
ncbi:hypothetical protein DAI22_08g148350 [Oryza sativa Japonica Group]|nr:hypothetical protein DAI22_08g148350 [Oryza sativa Japonica Group]